MAVSRERSQRGADPSGVSFVSISASHRADGVVVLDTAINDDCATSRAEALTAEAAYYYHRAIQEEQALGPGY